MSTGHETSTDPAATAPGMPPPPPAPPPPPPTLGRSAPPLPPPPAHAATHPGAPATAPVLRPSLPPAPERPTPSPVVVTPETTRFSQLLDEARRAPAPVTAHRSRPPLWRHLMRLGKAASAALLVSALLGAVSGGYGWYQRRERIQAVPTYPDAAASPASFWMSSNGRSADGLSYSYRVQRSPNSDSIVVEPTTGFDEMNGETLLMSAEGVWFFDRASGAVERVLASDQALWALFDDGSELKTFGEVITHDLRPFAELVSTTEPSVRVADSELPLTDHLLTVDLGRFREKDPQGFSVWAEMMQLESEDDELVPDRSTGDTFQIALTVDPNGMVWNMRLTQDDVLVAELVLDELSDVAFIPPDPTPGGPEATSPAPIDPATPPPVLLPVQTTP